jgi:hypothetical protein
VQTLPDPASSAEAIARALSGLSYLVAADPTAMAVQAPPAVTWAGPAAPAPTRTS